MKKADISELAKTEWPNQVAKAAMLCMEFRARREQEERQRETAPAIQPVKLSKPKTTRKRRIAA